MNISVGLVQGRDFVELDLIGAFTDRSGRVYPTGRHRFTSEIDLRPSDVEAPYVAFALDDVPIGIGFHWERKERQVFYGGRSAA